MPRPSVYIKKFFPFERKMGFKHNRNPSLHDISGLFDRISDQDHYDIRPRHINVITDELSFSDPEILQERANDPSTRDILVRDGQSGIYFESEDGNCAGNIYCKLEPQFLGAGEISMAGAAGAVFVMGLITKRPEPIIIGVGLGANALRTSRNARKAGLYLEVGSPQDIEPPMGYRSSQEKDSGVPIIRSTESSKSKNGISSYSPEELIKFKRFSGYLNTIDL